jgi:hypothetical protein
LLAWFAARIAATRRDLPKRDRLAAVRALCLERDQSLAAQMERRSAARRARRERNHVARRAARLALKRSRAEARPRDGPG